MRWLKIFFVCGLLNLCSSMAWAFPVDVARSEIKATFKQFNAPVSGVFKKFSGDVVFDPAKPQATRASLIIQTNSFDLGDAQYNKEVAGPDWFDAQKHPQATFKITAVKPLANGLQGEGELTLRGVTKKLVFPVSAVVKSGVQTFSGKATILRLDFGVGQGDWSDTALVADAVVIDFKLVVVQ